MTFLLGFGDELEKMGARKGLKIIRSLVEKGQVNKASRIAKSPGVLKPAKADPEMVGGKLIHRARTSPGHQIKHIGDGTEQVSTLVADSRHGVAVRKAHRKDSAITHPEQMDLKRDFARDAQTEGLKSSPKHLESWTGDAGHKMHMQEYVRGSKPHGKASTEAAREAMSEHNAFAKKKGYELQDMESTGNVVVRKKKGGGVQGVVLDPIVSRKGTKGRGTKRDKDPGGRKSPGEVMREVFNPEVEELDKYERVLEARRVAARRRGKRAE